MYLTEGIGAAATARPNPRPRSRPRLISTSRQIQRPEALRCAPLDTFLQVRAMARYRGPRVAHKEKCMARHKKSIPQHPRSFPPFTQRRVGLLALVRWKSGGHCAARNLPAVCAEDRVLQGAPAVVFRPTPWFEMASCVAGTAWGNVGAVSLSSAHHQEIVKARRAHFAGDFTFYMCVLCSSHNSGASTTCPPWTARVWSAPSSNGWRTWKACWGDTSRIRGNSFGSLFRVGSSARRLTTLGGGAMSSQQRAPCGVIRPTHSG